MKAEEMTYEQKRELAPKLESWLGCYTNEVIKKVLARIDEIINNDFVMKMIDELYQRSQKEQKETVDIFYLSLSGFQEVYFHSHVLTHSGSYRDILYDMFIADQDKEN